MGGAHLPLPGLEPVCGEPLMSVTCGQCDARPTVTFPATRHHLGWYQIILLGDRGTRVNNVPRVALDSGANKQNIVIMLQRRQCSEEKNKQANINA